MNRLQNETSPYLLQHADNPVHWHPWDEEALALARKTNKPILLSIGYSACHWCHVMAHESFESNQVAKLMNDNFVNIKVDREERPDIDRIYQRAHQILTRQGGGWPLTMFLDPQDHLPFFGGTYFPPQARQGMPGFRDVLKGIAKSYPPRDDKVTEFKEKLTEALNETLAGGDPGDIDRTMVDRACGQIDASFDEKQGGFSDKPKFPHPSGLELLLDAGAATSEAAQAERAAHMLDFTLEAMSRGGVYDHLGGGFFRYSVDAEWTIPHFEKMLYDNGPLLSLYAQRARLAGNAWFAEVASRTADWMVRDMQLDNGGICSSLDADSDGEEGRFYVWSSDEAYAVLGDDFEAFAQRFGMNNDANFEGRWHLRLAPPGADDVVTGGDENPHAGIEPLREKMFAARAERSAPGRDDKVLTAWNGLAVRGLADAGLCLGRAEYTDAACRAVDYLREQHWQDGRLLATSRNGAAHLDAYLDDHAFLLDAVLAVLSARWRDEDLAFACALADALLERFEDPARGGFFFTADDHEKLIQRARTFGDEALPSGNGVAAMALLELGHLTGETRYLEAGERALKAGMTDAGRWPSAHSTLMRAVLSWSEPPPRVVLRADDESAIAAWREAITAALGPRARCYAIPSASAGLSPLLDQRVGAEGASETAYVCSGHQCSAPVTRTEDLGQALPAA